MLGKYEKHVFRNISKVGTESSQFQVLLGS